MRVWCQHSGKVAESCGSNPTFDRQLVCLQVLSKSPGVVVNLQPLHNQARLQQREDSSYLSSAWLIASSQLGSPSLVGQAMMQKCVVQWYMYPHTVDG